MEFTQEQFNFLLKTTRSMMFDGTAMITRRKNFFVITLLSIDYDIIGADETKIYIQKDCKEIRYFKTKELTYSNIRIMYEVIKHSWSN